MSEEIVILITVGASAEATTIGRALIDEHLAACVNIVPGVRSLFFWEGKTQEAEEVLLICKSRLPLMDAVMARVRSLHSYSVPEIIALPVTAGLPSYLAWIRGSTNG
jgi:periplasmic divalent cation tolerance protein